MTGAACGGAPTAVERSSDAPTETLPGVGVSPTQKDLPPSPPNETSSDLVLDLPWPSDTEGPSDLEVALQLSGGDPLDAYSSRVDAFTVACMNRAGFDYAVGDVVDQGGLDALTADPVDLAGIQVSGGCSSWAVRAAFPGNYFGNTYQSLVDEATRRPEFVAAVDAYDRCLLGVGITGPPDVSDMNELDADSAITRYNEITSSCYTSSGRGSAERALEILVGDAFFAANRSEVEKYLVDVLSLIEGR